MKSFKVCVIIITRNRSEQLQHCLLSLLSQTRVPDEMLIIDNGSTGRTQELVVKLKKLTKLPIRIVYEKKQGRFAARNRGLKEAKSDWIAFIDDDCVASMDWIKSAEEVFSSSKKVPEAIMGKSDNYFPHNFYALSSHLINTFWKNNRIVRGVVLDPEILDTRNIFFDRKFVVKHKLQFRKMYPGKGMDFSEDCDFGMQLGRVGGVALYCEKAVVMHREPNRFWQYWGRFIEYECSHHEYEQTWKNDRKNEQRYYARFLPFAVKYCRDHHLSSALSFAVISHCLITIFLRKVVRFLLKVKLIQV